MSSLSPMQMPLLKVSQCSVAILPPHGNAQASEKVSFAEFPVKLFSPRTGL